MFVVALLFSASARRRESNARGEVVLVLRQIFTTPMFISMHSCISVVFGIAGFEMSKSILWHSLVHIVFASVYHGRRQGEDHRD